MTLRKTKGNLSLVLLALTIMGLLFAIMNHNQSIFADSVEDQVSAEEVGGNHYIDIFDNEEKITVRSDATTVGEVLSRAEIELNAGDIVEPALETQINE